MSCCDGGGDAATALPLLWFQSPPTVLCNTMKRTLALSSGPHFFSPAYSPRLSACGGPDTVMSCVAMMIFSLSLSRPLPFPALSPIKHVVSSHHPRLCRRLCQRQAVAVRHPPPTRKASGRCRRTQCGKYGASQGLREEITAFPLLHTPSAATWHSHAPISGAAFAFRYETVSLGLCPPHQRRLRCCRPFDPLLAPWRPHM